MDSVLQTKAVNSIKERCKKLNGVSRVKMLEENTYLQ